MKAYKDVDEYLASLSDETFNKCGMWIREGWKQAMRTARVQQQILIGELNEVKNKLHELEDQIDDWTTEAKEEWND